MKIVPDTSAIINGFITEKILSGEWEGAEIIIPNAVISELELQANEGRETGFVGLEEIKKITELSKEGKISLRFEGERPAVEEIKNAKYGFVDAKIRELAMKEKAVFVTSDRVQALVGEAYGLEVLYLVKEEEKKDEPPFLDFFDDVTLSVHLKENVAPMAKKGKPGNFKLVKISDRKLTREEIQEMAREIVEIARRRRDGYIEMDLKGATVVQIGEFRTAICYPPFSEGWEITVVRPVYKARLEDYNISEKLLERFREKAEGILIAGPPGSGKSTFAQALAEFYMKMGKIVKTMESPRDLQVPDEITQYAPLEGDMAKTADVLLLVRPDYTIYDEVRKTRDFQVFADMRLAGVGMIGVVHASKPVESIQRFVGRLDLGLIPHVVDTVIFIKDGEIRKVYSLELKVKVPSGMADEDLARPVVEVRDFESGTLEYEIYTFGEETVVIPVEKEVKSSVEKYAEEAIRAKIKKFVHFPFDLELKGGTAVLKVPASAIPGIIGKGGKKIAEIEEKLGIPIKVIEIDRPVIFLRGKNLVIACGEAVAGRKVTIYADGKPVITAKADKRGEIKVKRGTHEAKLLMKAKEIWCE